MSKRFYIGIILSCIMVCSIGLFLYIKSISFGTQEAVYAPTVLVPENITSKKSQIDTPEIISDSTVIASPSSLVSLLAVGDIMLDRSVLLKTQATGDYNHPFLLIDPLFKEYDFHLANLEGPITTNKSVANGTGGARFTFTFSPKFVEPLKKRFEFLSLANNHENNFGQSGIMQTRQFLKNAGVQYFGSPDNTAGFISVTSSYNGIIFGFVGYHQLVEKGFDTVLAEIQRLRPEVDVLIAMPHWGVEYVTSTPSYLQKQEGHAMIDAGVDIIVGSHPHVIEPLEIYKNKVILYSLGNFIFDQYFSEATQTGLAVGIHIEKGTKSITSTFDLIPLDINGKSQPSVADEKKRTQVLLELANSVSKENIFFNQIKGGKLYVTSTY